MWNEIFYKGAINMLLTTVSSPTEITASGQDWANHIAGYYTSDIQLKVILEFESRIDVELMQKAIRQSIDAEPILGCRFVEDPQNAYWKRYEDINQLTWCLFEEKQNKDEAIHTFLSNPIEPQEQLLHARIIRSQESDTLCLVINHACSDAAGAKDYIHLLASIYSHLVQDKDYTQAQNLSTHRDASKVYQALGIDDIRTAWNPQRIASKPTWAFPNYPGNKESLQIAMRKLDATAFSSLYSYSKINGKTINDLMLTAFYRAMFEMVSPPNEEPMELTATVDLRKYLPTKKAETICNLSGAINTRVARYSGEDFESTLARVSEAMNILKNDNPGIHNAAGMEIMRGMRYQDVEMFLRNAKQKGHESGKSSPLFSNMGIIADYPLKFGNVAINDLYIVSPAAFTPGLIFAFGTYNKAITITISYYEPLNRKKDVEHFLDLFIKELEVCMN
ncbi:hypothetical protein FOH38_18905 [Lysinibacillus fusiformis]|nr:hypothetical protein FOH38_18905 [Lysinibacillus fusiformis]